MREILLGIVTPSPACASPNRDDLKLRRQNTFQSIISRSLSHFFKNINSSKIQNETLTEIFGGTPGARLALAQGEAALPAQETPHPRPACCGARSSQSPFTPGPEVDAASGCRATPPRCSSTRFKRCRKPPFPNSSDPPRRSHLRAASPPWNQVGRRSERWGLHPGAEEVQPEPQPPPERGG